MLENVPFRIFRSLGILFFLVSNYGHACATCGLSQSFTPKMFFISLGFVALPLIFVGVLFFRLRGEAKMKNSDHKKTASSI